jgi:hypothetical protein
VSTELTFEDCKASGFSTVIHQKVRIILVVFKCVSLMFLPEIQTLRFIWKHINNKQEHTNRTDRIYIGYADPMYSKATGTQVVFRLKNNEVINPKNLIFLDLFLNIICLFLKELKVIYNAYRLLRTCIFCIPVFTFRQVTFFFILENL